MKVADTEIPGVLLIEPAFFDDNRGFFAEVYQHARYAQCGIKQPFVQDNISMSARNVLRGLHFQNPNPQGKLITVIIGRVMDVAVDVRIGSPTFGEYVAVELSEENRQQLWVPRGFAHGFVALSERAYVFYKCDTPYSPDDEIVLQWNDPAIGIDWNVESPSISARDQAGLPLDELMDRLLRFEV